MKKDKHLDDHILNIIQNNKIAEQSDIQKILKKRGYTIPQATLSRRLKKLNIAKISGIYKIVEYNQSHLPLILNMQINDSGFVVLHTQPGNANSLAYFLDQKYVSFSPKENKNGVILGTIAGDDTVLLILKSKTKIKEAISLIQKDFPYIRA